MSRAVKNGRVARPSVCIAMCCLLLIFFGGHGCASKTSPPGRSSQKEMGGGSIPVVASRVAQRDVPIDIRAVGNVEASSTVTVKSQVSGELVRVNFREGDFVKKGDPLFTVDARTYEAQLNQAQANLAKDEAALVQIEANLARDLAQQKYAQSEAARYSNLLEKHLVSTEQAEQVNANAEAAAAAVRADQAAIQSARATVEATKSAVVNARVMLSYTSIRSPLDGRTGNLDITEGNLIGPNTNLTTITQVEPIYVTFSVPESQLRSVKKGQPMSVFPQGNSSLKEIGELFFIDNAVDATTGTIRVKAILRNRDHTLWPGQFVRAVLRIGTRPGALIIPGQAVQTGQDGPFVFVVRPDKTVELRLVAPGAQIDGEVVIEKGLQPGETVVSEGQLRLAAGSRVQFRGNTEPF
jgi:multidrug efflux system membrane fusion protein